MSTPPGIIVEQVRRDREREAQRIRKLAQVAVRDARRRDRTTWTGVALDAAGWLLPLAPVCALVALLALGTCG